MLRASRSRIAFVYSVRFSRWRPGAGTCGSALRSISFSSQATSASRSPRSRVGPPSAGGMSPARSLRMAVSQISASRATASKGCASRFRPATCSVALWQSKQFPLTTAACRSPSLPTRPQPDASTPASAAATSSLVLKTPPFIRRFRPNKRNVSKRQFSRVIGAQILGGLDVSSAGWGVAHRYSGPAGSAPARRSTQAIVPLAALISES